MNFRSVHERLRQAVLLALAAPVLAGSSPVLSQPGEPSQEVETVTSWRQLLEEVLAAAEHLRPRIEEAEESDRALSRAEAEDLGAAYAEVRPLLSALKDRIEEVGETEGNELEQALDLFQRLEILLEKSQLFAAPEEPRNAPQVETMITNFAFYGSLRGRGFVDVDGNSGIDDNTSRIGIRGQADLGKDWRFFGRLEVGTNILSEITDVIVGGDPGNQQGREQVALPLRLGFVGFDLPGNRFSFGKQWSTYYDVAVFTDQAPFFAGNASGTYAAGTDGGISGTGRADQALQYRFAIRPIKFGVQAQLRNLTENDQAFADTWGLSAIYEFDEGVTLGAAFNKVRDGVANPKPDQPKEGDQAAILGVRWRNEKNYYAVNYADLRNHEVDDLGRFYRGEGWEFYLDRQLTERLNVGATWDYLKPDSNHPGEFKLDFLSVGLSYQIPSHWQFYAIYKFDNSRRSDGSPLGKDTLGVAVFYNFSLGFSLF